MIILSNAWSRKAKINGRRIEQEVCQRFNYTFVDEEYDAVDSDYHEIEIKSCQRYVTDSSRKNHTTYGRFRFKPSDYQHTQRKYFVFVLVDTDGTWEYRKIYAPKYISLFGVLDNIGWRTIWRKLP